MHELCERGADIKTKNSDGLLSLHIASYYGHLDIVRELLARGADIEAMTDDGETPLFSACRNSQVDVVHALLVLGANKRHISNTGHGAHDAANMEADTLSRLDTRVAAIHAILEDEVICRARAATLKRRQDQRPLRLKAGSLVDSQMPPVTVAAAASLPPPHSQAPPAARGPPRLHATSHCPDRL